MRTISKIGATAAGLVLLGGAAAAAGTTPDEADDPVTTVEAPDDAATAVEGQDRPEELEADADADADDQSTEDDTTEAPQEGSVTATDAPQSTHGATVSAVAQQDFASGREHGEAVSTVARGDHGPEVSDEGGAEEGGSDQG